MNYTKEEISHFLDERNQFEKRVEYIVSKINGDDEIVITSINLNDDYINIDYDYWAHGYRYNDSIMFPISLLSVSDELLEKYKQERIEIQKKIDEENKRKYLEQVIESEKKKLAELKAKYEPESCCQKLNL